LGVVLFEGLARQLGEDTGGQLACFVVGGLPFGRRSALPVEEAPQSDELCVRRGRSGRVLRLELRYTRRLATGADHEHDGSPHGHAGHDADDESDDHGCPLQAVMGVLPGRLRWSPALRGPPYRWGVTTTGMGADVAVDEGEDISEGWKR
jgi:hypothetical protein